MKKPTELHGWQYMQLKQGLFGMIDPKGRPETQKFDTEDQVKAYIEEKVTGSEEKKTEKSDS